MTPVHSEGPKAGLSLERPGLWCTFSLPCTPAHSDPQPGKSASTLTARPWLGSDLGWAMGTENGYQAWGQSKSPRKVILSLFYR